MPQLRELLIIGLLLSPTDFSFDDDTVFSPLHHERHISPDFCPTIPEKEIATLLLDKLCRRLEQLILPSELLPTMVLSRWDWPRLRELRLRGAQWSVPLTPYTALFSRMQVLRTIVLQLTFPEDDAPRPFTDSDTSEEFPWPNFYHPRAGIQAEPATSVALSNEFFELRWHIYHVAQVQVDGETRTELEAMTSDLYDLDVSDFWLETSYFLTELCFQWM